MAETRKYSDRAEYLKKAVIARRKKLKLLALEYKGNKCTFCGYDRCSSALEFHHLEKSNKHFGISQKGFSRSWTKVKAELNKCILVCSNCHKEIHAGQLQPSQEIENGKTR
jgi:hypothetical protein